MMREHILYIWKKQGEDGIQLLRVYGTSARIRIPEQIAGRTVKEIGAYCFSKRKFMSTEIWYTEYTNGKERTAPYRGEECIQTCDLQEISERYVEEVSLPDTVEKVGSFAFYNCTCLRKLAFGSRLREIGSDAFMNCLKLHQLQVRAHVTEPTGLKQILAQVKWNVEVSFEKILGECEAILLYPEYEESYDEIGPAHIFELNLTGEGFRARQCFTDGKVELTFYDEIFPQACVEEAESLLIQMAWDRLLYRETVEDAAAKRYEIYVKERTGKLIKKLIEQKKLSQLSLLFAWKYVTKTQAEEAVALASEAEWAEGTVSLIQWSRELEPVKNTDSVRSRYIF